MIITFPNLVRLAIFALAAAVAVRADAQGFTIDPKPTMDLGGNRGDAAVELTGVTINLSAVRLSDGRVAVGDRDHIKIFSRDGRLLQRVGRAGDGPGEFRNITFLCAAPGDTIVAADNSGRVIVFTASGAHVSTIESSHGGAVRDGCFTNGDFLATESVANGSGRASRGPAVIYRTSTLWRVARNGKDIAMLGTFQDASFNPYIPSVGNFVVYNDTIHIGNGSAPSLALHSAQGVLLRTIRWQQKSVPVTDSMVVAEAQNTVPANARNAASIAAAVGRARAAAIPKELPFYERVKVDARGRIWVQGYQLAHPSPPPWTVYNRNGTSLGNVALPSIAGAIGTIRLQSFGVDEVFLSWRDTDGFNHLTAHPVRTR